MCPRWALGREADFRKHHEASKIMAETARNNTLPPPLPPLGERVEEYHTPQFLYDIGKGAHVTAFSQKLPR